MSLLLVVVGFIILVIGHQASWLFVGGVSFLAGSLIADQLQIVRAEIEMIIFSLTCGLLGALLVVYLRKFMITLAAFVSGGYICFYLPAALGWNTNWINWVVVALVAFACAILTFVLGVIPLIVISSLLGATLITQYMLIGPIGSVSMFIVLCIFGLLVQWVLWHYSKPDTA